MTRYNRTKSSGRRLHDVGLPGLDHEGPILRMILLSLWSIDYESSIEALASTQFLLSDLVAHGTGNPVLGRSILFGISVKGKVREHFAQAALQLRFVTSYRHVAVRATVFDDGACFGMIQVLTAH